MIAFEKDLFFNEAEVWTKQGAKTYEGWDQPKLKNFEPIMARGSIQFHNTIGLALREKGWPDLRWPFGFDWNKYGYKFLLNFPDLLNQEAELEHDGKEITIETLANSAFWHGRGQTLWVRSENGAKGFTGGVFTRDTCCVEYEYMRQHNQLETALVIAKPKVVYEEHRLIFVDNKIISGSMYMQDGDKVEQEHIPRAIEVFGRCWGECYGHNWNRHFVLDIATTDNGLRVVEVNNLLTSGWYAADINKVVVALVESMKNGTGNN